MADIAHFEVWRHNDIGMSPLNGNSMRKSKHSILFAATALAGLVLQTTLVSATTTEEPPNSEAGVDVSSNATDGAKTLVSSINENFSSMTITENIIGSGSPLTCSGGIPTNTVTFSPSSITNKWGFHSSGSTYPITWSGTTSTQAWAISGNQMYFHGAKGAYDDGHAILTRDALDRTKYIIASADIRAYCSNSSSGCFAGIALINQEHNYRGLYLVSQPGNTVAVNRLAPCNNQTSGSTFSANTWQKLTVEYRGPEGGTWSYYINGQRVSDTSPVDPVGLANFVVSGIERTATGNTDLVLSGNPRVGLYTNAVSAGGYIEGGIANVSAITLSKITPSSASASSNSAAAGNAIDNNVSNSWGATTGGAQWIEIDLGSSKTIRKIRLLTEQTPAGTTSHEIYVGASPAPTTLVKTISGYTNTAQWLDETFVSSPPAGRYVRIYTPTSPSWRAWREIEVFE